MGSLVDLFMPSGHDYDLWSFKGPTDLFSDRWTTTTYHKRTPEGTELFYEIPVGDEIRAEDIEITLENGVLKIKAKSPAREPEKLTIKTNEN